MNDCIRNLLKTRNVLTTLSNERYKDVTGWSLKRMAEYMKAQGWKGFVLHWRDGEKVRIERTA